MATSADQTIEDENEPNEAYAPRSLPDDGYGKTFRRRNKSLELFLCNYTSGATLKFFKEYFSSGTWFEHFYPGIIHPNSASTAFVSNKSGALTGVTGGAVFIIESKSETKYLLLGFKNPLFGSCKTYITIKTDEVSPKIGYENAQDDTLKKQTVGRYTVKATFTEPHTGNKQILFSIWDKDK